MRKDSSLKDRLNNELFMMGQESLRSDELNKNIRDEFGVYFENKDMLQLAIDTGFLVFDYKFYCRNFKGSIFEAFLLSIIEIYQTAKRINQEECFSFLLAHEPTISRGFQNITDIAYTEQHKDIKRLNLYSKVCFRELGDFIEGSFQPFIKELYGLHLLKKNGSLSAIASIDKAKLGNAVISLIDNYEDLSVLYKHVLAGVPLHQWRNIAHHNSYLSNEISNEITCTYGSKGNKNTVVLTRTDLGRIFIGVINIQYLHKIAHAIFLADNVALMSAKRSKGVFSEDTAIMQSFETLASRGFKVIDLKRDENGIILEIEDIESRSVEEIEQSINKVVPIIFSLLNMLSLSVYSTNGILAFELKSYTNDVCG